MFVQEGNNPKLHYVIDSLTKTEKVQEEQISRTSAIEKRQAPPKDDMDVSSASDAMKNT